jgi:hypothetical protein
MMSDAAEASAAVVYLRCMSCSFWALDAVLNKDRGSVSSGLPTCG